jgi:hypothetical protein
MSISGWTTWRMRLAIVSRRRSSVGEGVGGMGGAWRCGGWVVMGEELPRRRPRLGPLISLPERICLFQEALSAPVGFIRVV